MSARTADLLAVGWMLAALLVTLIVKGAQAVDAPWLARIVGQ